MRRNYLIDFLFFALVLTSCSVGIRTNVVDFTQGFTDGNSKVWSLQKTISPEGAIQIKDPLHQEILVFYESGRCWLSSLQQMASGKGEKGTFQLDNETHRIVLVFPNETRIFEFEFRNENELTFYPLEGSDYRNAMELIPFPELN